MIYRDYIGVILGIFWGYIGIMEKKMETLGPFKGINRDYIGLFWGYIGIMERKWKLQFRVQGLRLSLSHLESP